ncbi:tigger transposable element-derived protein 4-like [Aphis craccivora]|uniref:Tigger transposable element-derived protein 4-like n=1 Tax=Aphis craccivora TaxID=307492 RepID=A0A6G0YDS5_APHCR|nr:tigger transposable element-derived protein 4-like [Aphis craccivora]
MDKFKLNDKCITTVQKPSRILGPKGQKQVWSTISWERGKNVTVVCCMNAADSLIPPMFIYPRDESNGICIVTLPPHISHKLQPLDLIFFGPLKTTFNRECDLSLKAHPHEKITMYDLASIFNKSYTKVATMDKGLSEFNNAGIFPLDPDEFTADDFAPAQELIEVEKEFTFENLENENEHCTGMAKEEDFYFPSLQDESTDIHGGKFSNIMQKK